MVEPANVFVRPKAQAAAAPLRSQVQAKQAKHSKVYNQRLATNLQALSLPPNRKLLPFLGPWAPSASSVAIFGSSGLAIQKQSASKRKVSLDPGRCVLKKQSQFICCPVPYVIYIRFAQTEDGQQPAVVERALAPL